VEAAGRLLHTELLAEAADVLGLAGMPSALS
jgi:hypothetical protein